MNQSKSEIVVKKVIFVGATSSNFFMEVIGAQNVKFAERTGSVD
jgi:hypothetical protein